LLPVIRALYIYGDKVISPRSYFSKTKKVREQGSLGDTTVDIFTHSEKVKTLVRIVRNDVLFLWLGRTRNIWRPQSNFAGHRDRAL